MKDFHLGGKEAGVTLGKKVSFAYLKGVRRATDRLAAVKDIDLVFLQKFFLFYQQVKSQLNMS